MQFYAKTKICCSSQALEELETLQTKSSFIVTDEFMYKFGFVDQVVSHLDRANISSYIFDKVEPDPTVQAITEATKIFLQCGADTIIALGGGSSIDAAKAIVYFAYKVNNIKPTLVAIPTTSGTGSEVTSISVITDSVNQVKIPISDELLLPDLAILDSRFTRTVPPSITAATGMDVLTHAIEAYTSTNSNSFANIYAERAVHYVFKYLYRAYREMDDMVAREKMLAGSCMAGMAFNNSGLGITHSMAHSLGGLFHVPHGLANAVLLPYVMEFNSFDVGVRYRSLASIISLKSDNVVAGANSFIQAVRDLNTKLGIPSRISELKIDESSFMANINTMADNVMVDICTKTNPRKPSKDDIKSLFMKAW